MTDTIRISVPGKPRGLMRARRSANGGMFDPRQNREEKERIGYAAKAARVLLYDGPMKIEVFARFKRPKAHFKANGAPRSDAPLYHTQTPDASNILKLVEDALIGIAYHDDRQIWDASCVKTWSTVDEITIFLHYHDQPETTEATP